MLHPMELLPLSGALSMGAIALAAAGAAAGVAPQAPSAPAATPSDLGATALSTTGWIGVYYAFLFLQSYTANRAWLAAARESKRKGERPKPLSAFKYGSAGGEAQLAADRTVGNMLEQGLPFLSALWAHACLLDARRAATLGWVYVATRVLYPAVFNPRRLNIFLSTLPGYGVICALLLPIAWAAANGTL